MILSQDWKASPSVHFYTFQPTGQPFTHDMTFLSLIEGCQGFHWNLPCQEVAEIPVQSVIADYLCAIKRLRGVKHFMSGNIIWKYKASSVLLSNMRWQTIFFSIPTT